MCAAYRRRNGEAAQLVKFKDMTVCKSSAGAVTSLAMEVQVH